MDIYRKFSVIIWWILKFENVFWLKWNIIYKNWSASETDKTHNKVAFLQRKWQYFLDYEIPD